MENNELLRKQFIISNRPDVEIIGTEFGVVTGNEGDGESGDLTNEISFACQKAIDAELAGKSYESIYMTLKFQDYGVSLKQKFLSFAGGCAQIMDPEDTDFDFIFEAPIYIFDATADRTGKFGITLSMCLSDTPEDIEKEGTLLFEKLASDKALFVLNDVCISNGFVTERIGSITGNLTVTEDERIILENVEYEDISYKIDDEPECEEDIEDLAGTVIE